MRIRRITQTLVASVCAVALSLSTAAYASPISDSATEFERISENFTAGSAQEVADLALAAVDYVQDSNLTEPSLQQTTLVPENDDPVLLPVHTDNSQQVEDKLIYTDVGNDVDMMYQKYNGGESKLSLS